jgi:hypothetical protein
LPVQGWCKVIQTKWSLCVLTKWTVTHVILFLGQTF